MQLGQNPLHFEALPLGVHVWAVGSIHLRACMLGVVAVYWRVRVVAVAFVAGAA